ncbi:MAG: tripartite tricarboxylate transporter substrate binding protein [Betaproteobacteria bacterium]|jgi:tripartite-type tricarboxylate transporter receptor subunit TctC|nr:tripartite tricarboxylate transporter substrate binding protein [Betaproteobacteria bacterium]
MIRRITTPALAGLIALAAALPATVQAQANWMPTKPIRVIVPFPPGGSNDIVGRLVANDMAPILGQQVVIDNRGGAGGIIGSEIAANSLPDGHTLLIASVAFAYNPSIYKGQVRFDPEKSFTPIALIGTGPSALTVNPKMPAKTTKELIDMAKAKPGSLTYATAGIGSFQHLSTELFRLQAGINLIHVPFKGGGPAMTDVIAGNTLITMGSLLQLVPHVQGNRLRLLAVGSAKRNSAFPNTPTVAETVPGYEANNWWGILAPAGVTPAMVRTLEAAVKKVVDNPEMQKKFDSQGAEVLYMNSAAYAKFIRAETAKWSKVVRDAGIKAE